MKTAIEYLLDVLGEEKLPKHNLIMSAKQIIALMEGFVSKFKAEPLPMKTTRTYNKGCEWCQGIGFVPTKDFGMGTTPLTTICPVCKGSKAIPVNEVIEFGQSVLEPGN